MDIKIIFGIIIGLGAILILAWFIYLKHQNRKEATLYLEGYADKIYQNIVNLILNQNNLFANRPLEEVEAIVLDSIYDSTWGYIEATARSAVSDTKLPSTVLGILNREFVDKFTDYIINEFNVVTLIEDHWKEVNGEEDFATRVEREDKELQEKYSDDNFYVEEIDEKNDLELVDAGTAYVTNEDGITDVIERPDDVEDPVLDTVEDESIEVIGEDGLTDSEREAGIHFNKAGRKVDKKGRFVKS